MTTDAKLLSEMHVPVALARSLITVWLVTFQKSTGQILQCLRQSPDTVKPLLSDDVGVCEIPGDGLSSIGDALPFMADNYVDSTGFWPQIKPKEPCPAVLDGMVLSSVPIPSKVSITAPLEPPRQYDAQSPTIELSFAHAGNYLVTVSSVKYLTGVYQVTATGDNNGKA